MWNVTPGVIDRTTVRAFKYGACGGLAIALHDLTGHALVAVTVNEEALHYMVRLPDGRLVDIEGAHAVDDVTFEYEVEADDGTVTVVDVTREQVWAWWTDYAGQPVPMDTVRSIAPLVLAGLS